MDCDESLTDGLLNAGYGPVFANGIHHGICKMRIGNGLDALSRTDVKTIAKHKDRLFDLLENRPCTWTKCNALIALAKLCADPAHYKTTLAPTLHGSSRVWNNAASYRFNRTLREALSKAPPNVKEYASPLIQKTYASIPPKLVANTRGEALGMTVRSVAGNQYLLVEIGGFPEETAPDFQCAHTLHVKD